VNIRVRSSALALVVKLAVQPVVIATFPSGGNAVSKNLAILLPFILGIGPTAKLVL
jgi:hypothetical protein